MKVLWVVERFPPQRGGVAAAAGREVTLLAPHLERLDVVCLTGDGLPGHVELGEHGEARVHRVGRPRSDEEALHLLYLTARGLLARHGHDLVHGFYAVPAGYVATLAARAMDRPCVVSLRGNDIDRGLFHGGRAAHLRWTLERATAVTGVSRDLLDKARLLTGRTGGLEYLPNGTDPERFQPGDPEPAHLGPLTGCPRPWLGFAGELRFKKGLDPLLELARDRARRGSGTVVAIGGIREDDRRTVERFRATEPGPAARFVEVPYLRDEARLRSHYRAMDAFVFPSLWDGLPNALLEAMACARPVVATAVGGIPDVIEGGRSGILVPLGEISRLPEVVEALLARPAAARAALGQAARARVVAGFTEEAERRALLDLYARVAGTTAAAS